MTDFTEEQQMIRETVARLAAEKIDPLAAAADKAGRSSIEVLDLIKEHDLLKCGVPASYGGIGADHTTLAVVIEEMAKVDASTAMIIFASHTLIMHLRQWGSEDQKSDFFSRMSSGDKVNAFSLTEPDYGSESASIRTRAVLDGESYVLNGTKIFVTNGDIADFFLVFVRTGEGSRHRGLSALIVEKDTPGFSRGKHEDKLGLRGSDLCELIFENARVPRENLLGRPGGAWELLMTTAADMRAYGPGAMGVGLARGSLDYAVQYAKERIQFGIPIGHHQAIQFMLADMAIQTEAARSLLYRTTRLLDSGKAGRHERSRLTSAVKCYASDVAMKVAEDAVQILGGYGVMKDYPLERKMRDAKMIQIFDGTNQIQRRIVAKSLLF